MPSMLHLEAEQRTVAKVKPVLSEMTTPRLRLRLWQESDAEPFAAMNGDPRVREHYPSVLTREESDASVARIRAHFEKHGFGAWAVELRARPGFIGFAGLTRPTFSAPCGPCVEIGWRFAFDHWGQGYATEAGRAALRIGFQEIGLDEVVSFTTVDNLRSRRVMEKLGLSHNPADDFDHPLLPAGHRQARHVLYRLHRTDWLRLAEQPAT